MKNKIVIYTGSFNPITKAHRLVLEKAVEELNAEFGLFVEVSDAYLTNKLVVKRHDTNAFLLNDQTRQKMIESLAKDYPNLKFGGIELGGESPSTGRTLRAIARQYKNYQIIYLCGADKLHSIPRWTNIEEILSTIGIAVVPREGFDIKATIASDPILTKYKDNITLIKDIPDAFGISSTKVRYNYFNDLDNTKLMDQGPLAVLNSIPKDSFKPLTAEDVIKATIEYGGRFGGNQARQIVAKENIKYYKTLPLDKYKTAKTYKKSFTTSSTNCYDTITGVINADCVDVAKSLAAKNTNPAILNLASAIKPCGGFNKGSNAQEESLCYMSTLPMSLYQFASPRLKFVRDLFGENTIAGVYPLDINYGGVYSPNVMFFRNNIDKYYSLLDNTFTASVISVASLANSPEGEFNTDERSFFNADGTLNREGKEIELNKIRTIYRIALDNNHDSLVLGAFGCGVYHLLPEEVSELFASVLEEPEFKNKFKYVTFAILEGKTARKPVGANGKFAAFYHKFGTYML